MTLNTSPGFTVAAWKKAEGGSMTIPIETLRTILECNSETGELRWKRRPVEMFNASGRFTKEHLAKIWNARFAGKVALDVVSSKGYRHGRVLDQYLSAHRAVWALHHNEWPETIDHINGNPSDNRIENLRSVAHAQNMKNRKLPVTNTSGVQGVRWCKVARKWVANIKVNQRMKNLGHFSERNLAVQARLQAEIEHGFHPNHGRK